MQINLQQLLVSPF